MNQQDLWNTIHTKAEHEQYSQVPSEFAEKTLTYLPAHAEVLELGCGFGADAAFLAQQGCAVTATDFSEVAIARDQQAYSRMPGLTFQVVDMGSGALPFQATQFDGVYAKLSLHYYTDEVTKKLFQDIARIVKPHGIVAFTCKSTDDPLYGQGTELEANMFENKGHIRHFFDEAYARSLLTNFMIETFEQKKEDLYGFPSAYIKVIARKLHKHTQSVTSV